MQTKPAPVVLDVEAFRKAAIRVGLTRTVNGVTTLSQSRVARHLGVNQGTISRALQGSPVSAPLIAAVLEKFPVIYNEVFRSQERSAA